MTGVVFVAGTGRSGSTVFELALAQRLGIPATGELVTVWSRGVIENRRCSCGARFWACPFWSAVRATAPEQFRPVVAERVLAQLRPLQRALAPGRCLTAAGRAGLVGTVDVGWVRATTALYDGVAEVTGSPWLCDSSKAPVLAWLLAATTQLDVAIVHLVRDPRQVAASWRRPHPVPPGVAPMPRQSPLVAAVVWDLVNAASIAVAGAVARGEHERDRRTAPVRGGTTGPVRPGALVRYEDFVADPDRVLEALVDAEAVGPDVSGTVEAKPAVSVTPAAHTMSGNPGVRLAPGPVTVGARSNGRSGVADTLADVVVEVVTGPWLGRYGYPLRRGRGAVGVS